MEKTRVRAPAFTDKEDEALIKAYSRNRNLIRGRNSMGVSQRTRNEAWDAVARDVNNADGRCERTVKSVKIHYGNMLAEYKAFKSNDRTSRNSHQNPQPFFKFFDELFGEKSADSSAGFDVNGEEYSVDGCSDEFSGPNGQSNLLAALCGGDSTARYATGGTAFNALMNSVQAVVENGAVGGDNFLQVANYLSALPSVGHLKQESDHHNPPGGGSDSERTSAATSRAANTPPAAYLLSNNNNGNGSANNFAALLSGGLVNGVGGGPVTDKPTRQQAAKKRRGSNASAIANAEEQLINGKTNDVEDRESAACQRRINALRMKILEKELSVLEWKEETLRKKNHLLDLKIANQLRASGGETPAGAGASDSMDTTAAFEKSLVVVKSDIIDEPEVAAETEAGLSPQPQVEAETEAGLSPPRKLARLDGETNGGDARPAAALEESILSAEDNDQPLDFLNATADGSATSQTDESEYSMLNGGNLIISNSQASML